MADLNVAVVEQYRARALSLLDRLPASKETAALRARLTGQPPTRAVTNLEAAEMVGCLGADGQPTDRFYKTVAPRIGRKDNGRWTFSEARVLAYLAETS